MSLPAPEPARGSQCARILRLLRRHENGWVKSNAIYAECGSMGALHSRIAELRKRGHTIEWRQDRAYRLVTLTPGDAALTAARAKRALTSGVPRKPIPGLPLRGRDSAAAVSAGTPSVSAPILEPWAAGDGPASPRRAVTPGASSARSRVGEQLSMEAA